MPHLGRSLLACVERDSEIERQLFSGYERSQLAGKNTHGAKIFIFYFEHAAKRKQLKIVFRPDVTDQSSTDCLVCFEQISGRFWLRGKTAIHVFFLPQSLESGR